MNTTLSLNTERYAKVIEVSKRVRWDIDRDVFRGRNFDFDRKFLPDGLSLANELTFLSPAEQRLMSQIQGRTYACFFGLIERFIGAKMLEVTGQHSLGDQVAMEALVRFTDEELKHQEMFRRIEQMIGAAMPAGYRLVPVANDVARLVLGKSTWAVLALTCMIELVTQTHYRQSIQADAELSELFKDVFLFHWKEESQHAILDEMEWQLENLRVTDAQRIQGVDDVLAIVGAFDATVDGQAQADTDYFLSICARRFTASEVAQISAGMLKAYRWQYIVSGAAEPRFQKLMFGMVDNEQATRIQSALAPLAYAVPAVSALKAA